MKTMQKQIENYSKEIARLKKEAETSKKTEEYLKSEIQKLQKQNKKNSKEIIRLSDLTPQASTRTPTPPSSPNAIKRTSVLALNTTISNVLSKYSKEPVNSESFNF